MLLHHEYQGRTIYSCVDSSLAQGSIAMSVQVRKNFRSAKYTCSQIKMDTALTAAFMPGLLQMLYRCLCLHHSCSRAALT